MIRLCEYQGDASLCKKGLTKLLSDAEEQWSDLQLAWQALENFLPRPDQINALPTGIRQYIHDLETRCDPAGDVAELTLLGDQNAQLQAKIVQLESEKVEA